MSKHSDFLIIGGGPGGYETAAEAVSRGFTVTLVERGHLGGTCLNRGCIPTKCLCRSAEIATTVAEAAGFGVDVGSFTLSYSKAVERMGAVVASLREGVSSVLKGVDVVAGEARFMDDRTVAVGDQTYTADKIIIATGSAPAKLQVEGAELAVDSDYILSSASLPSDILIVGGGVIGLEFASIFNAFGVEVKVMEYCKEILPAFDSDIAKRLRTMLTRRGIKFLTSSALKAIRRVEEGFEAEYEGKKGAETIKTSQVFMAVGRRPVLPPGIESTSIAYTKKGITVDAGMCASVDGIYAIGDVNGRCMLAHAATAQGRVVLGENIDLSVIPSAVFTSPEVAMVGMTEEQCKAEGVDYKAGKAMFGANGKAMALGEAVGLAKILYNPTTGSIYGAHVLGPHASDLLQEVATVMAAGGSVKTIADAVHAHPTLGEVVAQAASNAVL